MLKLPDIDYNAFIKWAQEDPQGRYVEIKTEHCNANVVSVFVNNYVTDTGGYVKSIEEIEELKEKKKQRELAEYERLKSKFEPASAETNLCGTCRNEFPTCPAKHIVFGCDVGGKPSDDNIVKCDSYEPKTNSCDMGIQ
jgi:hypothetical protein